MTCKYIPRVLLCGNAEIFLRQLGGRQVDIVAQIEFDDGKFFSDGSEIPEEDCPKFFDDADYVIFDDSAKFATNFEELTKLVGENKILTRDDFLRFAGDNFFALANVRILLEVIEQLNISRLLDADKFFSRNEIFGTFAYGLEVDGIDENISVRRFPLVENFYRKIYATFDDCRLNTYDAILLTADRSADEIFDEIVATDAVTKNILLFARKNSAQESWLAENSIAFARVENFPAINGSWILLTKFAPPEDFCLYNPAELPADTGENLNDLRHYLGDELIALYWLWKNTRHTTTGLFDEEIDSSQAAEILSDCDMLVAQGNFSALTPHEQTLALCGEYLNEYVETIFRKHIKAVQPEYLSAFDFVSQGHCLFPFGKFVTRRNIFDSYCAWLFSFVPDVAREVLDTTNISSVENPKKYRVVALIAERLLTVWLAKNSMRLIPVL